MILHPVRAASPTGFYSHEHRRTQNVGTSLTVYPLIWLDESA